MVSTATFANVFVYILGCTEMTPVDFFRPPGVDRNVYDTREDFRNHCVGRYDGFDTRPHLFMLMRFLHYGPKILI